MINEHLQHWLGRPVEEFGPERRNGPLDRSKIYRLAVGFDDEVDFPTLFQRFLQQDGVAETSALIIGCWFTDGPEPSAEVVRMLAGSRQQLPALQAIFLGDLVCEEAEVSWIEQGDVSPLLQAYPGLTHFRIRGSSGLSFGNRLAHSNLRSLAIETGGLPSTVVRELCQSQLPALEELELWLGTDDYGGDTSEKDVVPILAGKLFPNLRHLGLKNCVWQDRVAELVAAAPVVEQLQTLDLSLGTLGDEGGEALLQAKARLARLQRLDLHRHYLSDAMMARLRSAFPQAALDEQQQADDPEDRYVAVSE